VRKPEIIAEGLLVPEGPVWCPDDTLVVTSVAEGALYRIWPEQRRKQKIADVQGGANSAALAGDGGFVVTQNGGIDFGNVPFEGFAGREWPKPRYVSPGLQRATSTQATTTRTFRSIKSACSYRRLCGKAALCGPLVPEPFDHWRDNASQT
jgi:hypothetical protein